MKNEKKEKSKQTGDTAKNRTTVSRILTAYTHRATKGRKSEANPPQKRCVLARKNPKTHTHTENRNSKKKPPKRKKEINRQTGTELRDDLSDWKGRVRYGIGIAKGSMDRWRSKRWVRNTQYTPIYPILDVLYLYCSCRVGVERLS